MSVRVAADGGWQVAARELKPLHFAACPCQQYERGSDGAKALPPQRAHDFSCADVYWNAVCITWACMHVRDKGTSSAHLYKLLAMHTHSCNMYTYRLLDGTLLVHGRELVLLLKLALHKICHRVDRLRKTE